MNKDGEPNLTKKDWIVQFLNLPPKDQIEFLFRHTLETEIRKEVEKKVFGKTE